MVSISKMNDGREYAISEAGQPVGFAFRSHDGTSYAIDYTSRKAQQENNMVLNEITAQNFMPLSVMMSEPDYDKVTSYGLVLSVDRTV